MNDMSNKVKLNPNQHQAVVTTDRYVRIVAGAGSGKTRVLIERISHLITELGVFPSSILAITFTNKAANEMKERLNRMMASQAAGVHISTIHSLCVRILREDSPSMDLPRNFTVLDQDDQKSILKEAYKEIGLEIQKISLSSMLDYIGANKGAEVSVARALELAGSHIGEQEKARVYQYYCERQKALFALDFDDLLLVTVKMFDRFSSICEKWQRRFNFIHVDEFQDIDHVQYKLIRQLAGSENQVYVVGDPDQTIYTWRGADVNIIMNFEKDYQPTTTIILNQNYRSTHHILEGANSMIKHNQNRVEKALFTEKESAEKVTHCAFPDEDSESRWILDMVKKRHDRGISYKDMAILYRSNYLSRSIEKGCLDAQVPYVIYGGTRFYDRAEIKDMLSYLRMLTTSDDLAFTRIINSPKRGLGQKTIDTIVLEAKKNKRTYYQQVLEANPISGKSGNTLDNFVQMIERFKAMMGQKPILEILEAVANESGLRAQYEANHEVDRLENIKELINDVITFQNTYPEAGLDEYLQMVSLYGDKNDMTSGEYLQLMTIHAAKGLEFDTVFVVGLSEGIFPSERSMSEGRRGLEEERRLAYVAYTRAKNKLFLSEVSGYSFVLTRVRSRSRFVDEVDEKHIDHIGVNYDYKKPQANPNPKAPPKLEAVFASDLTKKVKVNYKVGEIVEHSSFGEGVILSLDGGLAEIAFDYPAGVKKMMINHPSITKISAESAHDRITH